MFTDTSRYAKTATDTVTDRDGREVQAIRLRALKLRPQKAAAAKNLGFCPPAAGSAPTGGVDACEEWRCSLAGYGRWPDACPIL